MTALFIALNSERDHQRERGQTPGSLPCYLLKVWFVFSFETIKDLKADFVKQNSGSSHEPADQSGLCPAPYIAVLFIQGVFV